VKKIKLTQNQYTLVDDEDYNKLNQWKWCALYQPSVDDFYAVRHSPLKNGKRITIYMHRLISNAPRDKQVDHISHATLDNRKQNLRICTQAQNQHNTKLRKNTSSKYKGVSWCKINKKWLTQIRINTRGVYLGSFKSEIQAARAYDRKARELFGEFALLNFKEPIKIVV